MTSTTDPRFTAYLAGLDAALQPLGPGPRADLVREIEGHLYERASQGRLDEAIAALGSPDEFARPFVEDHDLSGALHRASPIALLFGILGRAARSALAMVAGFVAVVFYLLTFGFAAVGLLKPITPNNVGAWNDPDGFTFGALYGVAHRSPELIGYWIVPLCAIAAVLCYVVATAVLRFSGRLLLNRSQRPALA